MKEELITDRVNDPMRRRVWPDDYQGDGDDHGVRCPKCNCADTRVDQHRKTYGNRNMRDRICRHCGHEFRSCEKAV